MAAYQRYAIYFCPNENSELSEFGARWLGWDIHRGAHREQFVFSDLPKPLDEITKRPRKYGFHATLKAPFHLAMGVDQEDLLSALVDFSTSASPVDLSQIELVEMGRFIALKPGATNKVLQTFAQQIVQEFDRFRAPLSAETRARYGAKNLNSKQAKFLEKWGYPFVFDAFRFHMTMTGPLNGEDRNACLQVLTRKMHPMLKAPIILDHLALCGEREDGHFQVIEQVPLKG